MERFFFMRMNGVFAWWCGWSIALFFLSLSFACCSCIKSLREMYTLYIDMRKAKSKDLIDVLFPSFVLISCYRKYSCHAIASTQRIKLLIFRLKAKFMRVHTYHDRQFKETFCKSIDWKTFNKITMKNHILSKILHNLYNIFCNFKHYFILNSSVSYFDSFLM